MNHSFHPPMVNSKDLRILLLGSDEKIFQFPKKSKKGNASFYFERETTKVFQHVRDDGINLILIDITKEKRLEDLKILCSLTPNIPVIALLDGVKKRDTVSNVLNAGAQDYVDSNELTLELLLSMANHAIERKRAEKKATNKLADLQCLRQEYQAILRSTPTGLCMLNPDWRIRWVNHALNFLLNPNSIETQELVGLPFECFFEKPEDFKRYREEARSGIQNQGIDKREIRLCRLDGSPLFAEISMVRVDPSQTDPGFVVSVFDITERKMAFKQLQTLSKVVEQTGDAVLVTNKEGIIEFVNPAFEYVTGYTREEVTGRSPRILKSGVQNSSFYENLWDTILAGQVFRGVFINKKKDGYLFYDEQTITPIKDAEGKITHFVSTARDITDRKRAEEDLLKKNREIQDMKMKYQAILKSTPNGHCILSSNWLILWANDSMNKILDPECVSTESTEVKPFQMLFPDKKAFEEYKKDVLYFLRTKGIDLREIQLKRGDESLFWAEISIVRIDPSQTGGGFLATVSDITERRRMTNELSQKERLAAIGQTISSVSHCMKNLVTVISGGVAVLKDALEKKDRKKSLKAYDILAKSSKRLYISVLNMLDYSKRGQMTKEDASLSKIFDEVIQMLEECTDPSQFRFISEVEPEARVYSFDSQSVFRALLNLGGNALDAMPDGGTLRLAARLVSAKDLGSSRYNLSPRLKKTKKPVLMIEVSDTGTGIPKENIERIFEPFFTEKGSKGTGLGLACVKQYVEDHGGTISVETELEKGSTFRIFLP